MQATAHSNVINILNPIIKIINGNVGLLYAWPPSKDNNKWPAIMLAANRTAKVKGRINILTDSITTINGINTPGVPSGTKWHML